MKVYNHEFNDLTELQSLVQMLMDDLNHNENSQATGMPPALRWTEDKADLKLYDDDLLAVYASPKSELIRKVSKEALVLYEGKKYSVPVQAIGHNVLLEVDGDWLEIYDAGNLISEHRLSNKHYNYRRQDYKEILQSDVLGHLDETELEAYVDENLQAYDLL